MTRREAIDDQGDISGRIEPLGPIDLAAVELAVPHDHASAAVQKDDRRTRSTAVRAKEIGIENGMLIVQ